MGRGRPARLRCPVWARLPVLSAPAGPARNGIGDGGVMRREAAAPEAQRDRPRASAAESPPRGQPATPRWLAAPRAELTGIERKTTLRFVERPRDLTGHCRCSPLRYLGVVHNGVESTTDACEALHTFLPRRRHSDYDHQCAAARRLRAAAVPQARRRRRHLRCHCLLRRSDTPLLGGRRGQAMVGSDRTANFDLCGLDGSWHRWRGRLHRLLRPVR